MNKKLNSALKLTGLTLIELAVTLAIVAIMAGFSIKQMNSLKSSKKIVDNVTDIIVTQLNQAQAKSNFSSVTSANASKVCHVIPGTGATGRAYCDNAIATWRNVNGIKLDQKANVTVASYTNTGSAATQKTVAYVKGIIDPALQLGNSTTAAFIISVTGNTTDPSCGNLITPINSINIWPNGVINVDKNC